MLGALPYWAILGWILHFVATGLVVDGMHFLFRPYFKENAGAVVPALDRMGLFITFFSFLLILVTERIVALKMALRGAPENACEAPCYGFKRAKYCRVCFSAYAAFLLLASWANVVVAILGALAAHTVAVVFICIAVLIDKGGEESVEAVNNMLDFLDRPPLTVAEVANLTAVVDEIVETADPPAMVRASVRVIVGGCIFTFVSMIFLASYSGTYAASDTARETRALVGKAAKSKAEPNFSTIEMTKAGNRA